MFPRSKFQERDASEQRKENGPEDTRNNYLEGGGQKENWYERLKQPRGQLLSYLLTFVPSEVNYSRLPIRNRRSSPPSTSNSTAKT